MGAAYMRIHSGRSGLTEDCHLCKLLHRNGNGNAVVEKNNV